MLGIEDKYVLAAYLLCIGATVLCIVYIIIIWNRGDDSVKPSDVEWAKHEKQVEKEISDQ